MYSEQTAIQLPCTTSGSKLHAKEALNYSLYMLLPQTTASCGLTLYCLLSMPEAQFIAVFRPKRQPLMSPRLEQL